ncbi:putative NUDIX hydrolase [Photorhabdus australis subsp. thailandensis]|uniref:Putative NUDIX hydrolase n=1 Tax=Photorhabdus australis subsp. thailandensis TaxID=2805096 RepID=A0A1C0U4L1_9GAMM|nr:CoA pyrophosphatase [Photorhabdus australis]OCQ52835.1 putative NUDIX hydrolase [Photorhabdus australis subsp. thailandensis]
MILLSDFINRFQLQRPSHPKRPANNRRHAAVLLPIIRKPKPTLLLTQRSTTLRSHSGQVAFPGGAADPEDKSIIATALREAEEEVNIPHHKVQVLGQLMPLDSISGYLVTPIIGLLPPELSFHRNPTEVSSIFEVPLSEALSLSSYHYLDVNRRGQQHRIYFYWYQGRLIWGLTAAIIHQLAQQVQT